MTPVARETKMHMRKHSSAKTPQPAVKPHSPEIRRRINAGWLKLWKAVYPNTPPPTEVPSLRSKAQSPGNRRPAAVERLASFLVAWLVLVLLATGCAGPRPAQGRQGRHDAQAGRGHRADPGPRGEPVPGHEAGPGDRQGADLHRARRLASGAIPGAGGRASPRAQTRTSRRIRAREDAQPSTTQLSTLNHLHPQRSHAGGRARGNPRPDGAGRGAEGHGAGAGSQAFQPQGHCLGGRWACSCSAWRRWCGRRSRWSSAA